MGKVIRTDKDGVQKLRAKDIVPGDICEISGTYANGFGFLKSSLIIWFKNSFYLNQNTSKIF